MKWQEYQDAVAQLYEQMQGIGRVHKNITLPDKDTGQPRQVDVWIEMEAKTLKIGILIDAKFRKDKIDVKDVELVLGLATAVGANKSVIVASNSWTDPARQKADRCRMDLRLFTIEKALDILVPEKWMMCPSCENDCVVLDRDGAVDVNGLWLLWLAGKCRECGAAVVWCQDCGEQESIPTNNVWECYCGHNWGNSTAGMTLRPSGAKDEFSF